MHNKIHRKAYRLSETTFSYYYNCNWINYKTKKKTSEKRDTRYNTYLDNNITLCGKARFPYTRGRRTRLLY